MFIKRLIYSYNVPTTAITTKRSDLLRSIPLLTAGYSIAGSKSPIGSSKSIINSSKSPIQRYYSLIKFFFYSVYFRLLIILVRPATLGSRNRKYEFIRYNYLNSSQVIIRAYKGVTI